MVEKYINLYESILSEEQSLEFSANQISFIAEPGAVA
jgi:hypothetical protein